MKTAKVRRSQLISTYGVGGLIPAESESFIIRGLDDWTAVDEVHEPRLARALNVPAGFRFPPSSKGGRDIPVLRFPTVMTCPQCERLGRRHDFETTWNEAVCKLHKPNVALTPSRLVIACENGHLDDFPYYQWLHRDAGGDGPNDDTKHKMYLRSEGRTSSLADLRISCSCGIEPIGLDGAFEKDALRGVRWCQGRRPWLGGPHEECTLVPRTLQRGASNVWFPAVRSAISIPPFSEAVAKFVTKKWTVLRKPELLANDSLLDALVEEAKGKFTVDEIRREARRRLELEEGPAPTDDGIRLDEYRALRDGYPDVGNRSDFVCETVAVPAELTDLVAAVRKVTRLREVRALQGFSRLAAISDPSDPRFCKLTREPQPSWLPAIEVLGEGVFLDLHGAVVKRWAESAFAFARRDLLQASADRAAAESGNPQPRQIDIAQVAVHTLAHILIDQLALDAGYPAASIRERLFVGDDMTGILLYTATSDSAGSLGGLAAQADPDDLGKTVLEAAARLGWCSSDPVCIESTASGTDGLNLAACHACVLAPETSCELQNVLLDRACLFGTPELSDSGLLGMLTTAERGRA